MSRADSRFLMMARPAVAGVLLAFCAMPAWSAPPRPHPSDSLLVIEPLYADSTPVRQGFLYRRELLRPRLGLTLSGGGARGVAQIGVLKVVERHRIPIYVITGTSMGAIIGGLYASGYTAAELETLALTTDWDDVLSLSDASERRDLFLDQKSVDDRSFIALRFQGLEPVIPTAVSSGQRLTDFLNQKILQGLYHAHPTFDELKIPFRAVATDLVSGRSVILRNGSLAEALRASATVPILFQPVEKDSMRLLDGGLVRNIPVDVARESGADMVLAVNTTSGLRGADQMTAPWQTADQIMGIMMQLPNEEQLAGADIVLTPRLGEHLSSNFTGLDSLIALGERAADSSLTKIVGLYRARMDSLVDPAERLRAFTDCRVMHADPDLHPSSVHDIGFPPYAPILTMGEIRNAVNRLYDTGMYREVHAEIRKRQGHDITIVTVPNPPLTGVEFSGCAVMPDSNLRKLASGMLGNTINVHDASRFLEDVVRAYRAQGYSLARIDSMTFDESTGVLRIRMDEGVIADVQIEGGIRTQDAFVLREFVLRPGDVFEIGKAQQGITNISSTDLFEYVYLEVDYVTNRPLLRIRIRERPSQLLRLGVRADNERHLQGLVDIRDDNFRGTGMVLGLAVAGGVRNVEAVLDFQARRLFDTYMTLGAGVFYRQRDAYLYADGPPPAENRWVRENVGEYRDRRFGMQFAFGGLLERLGNATAEYSWQRVRVDNLRNAKDLVEEFDLAMIRLNTIVDTKDAYPFPTTGIAFTLSYEFALKTLGGDVGYNALRIQYESYSTWGNTITFHPRFTMGFADQTMPFAQQFHLGGRESFYGLREDDRLGRQVLVANIEFRYTLPVKLLFDTYIRARYDIGTISSVPEEITLNSLLHGVGVELAWATPVGPAAVGAGQAFYFAEARPQNTLQRGPVLWYFMIGYEL